MKKTPPNSPITASDRSLTQPTPPKKDASMPYQNLAFMSYAVPTFYPSPPGVVAPAGGAPAIQLADPDLEARAQRFLNVLFWTQAQYANRPWMSDDKTLKVFQAPEFYFRRATANEVGNAQFSLANFYGSYPEASRYRLAEALYGAIHGRPEFADWTITAGTICSVLPITDPTRLDLLNTAIMMRGQRSTTDSSVPYILMEKHYISNIDGPPATWHVNLNPTSVFSFQLNPDQSLDNIIRWDNMLTGLEVCLDHGLGVLSDAMIRLWSVFGPEIPRVDLQAITSCGMDIVQPHVAVRDGGLVLLTDGMSHQVSGYPTPISRLGRYVRQNNLFAVIDADLPALSVLPGGPNYNVAYPNYAGQQGVYAFEPLRMIER